MINNIINLFLIDDDPVQHYILGRLVKIVDLGGQEIVMHSFMSADDFLETFSQISKQCDVIMLDINMPGMNGFDLLEKLKPVLRASVFMFSSSDGTADRRRAFSFDVVKDYILKPLDDRKLKEVINSFKLSRVVN